MLELKWDVILPTRQLPVVLKENLLRLKTSYYGFEREIQGFQKFEEKKRKEKIKVVECSIFVLNYIPFNKCFYNWNNCVAKQPTSLTLCKYLLSKGFSLIIKTINKKETQKKKCKKKIVLGSSGHELLIDVV